MFKITLSAGRMKKKNGLVKTVVINVTVFIHVSVPT